MELRAQYQWASYNLNSRKYVEITDIYNSELEARNAGKAQIIVKKTPRALMERLSNVEAIVHERIAAKNFKCEC